MSSLYFNKVWTEIEKALSDVVAKGNVPVAAFDADGTLWATDLGENFFKYQIRHLDLNLPPNPWEHYMEMKKADPTKAYLWLAQICQGHSIDEVEAWARAAVADMGTVPIFEMQRQIIEKLQANGVLVYVVTASVKWAVEPGTDLLGIPRGQVLGVHTEIVDNKVTDIQKGMITYRKGKLDALLADTDGRRPFFVSGNSFGDLEMLAGSTHLRLAVCSTEIGDGLFGAEQELQREAGKRKWLTMNLK